MKEQVFKIGRTKQEHCKRFDSYPKGSEILLLVKCPNCIVVETQLIQIFKIKYTQCKQYGTEYFEGDPEVMIDDIMTVVKKHKNKVNKDQICSNVFYSNQKTVATKKTLNKTFDDEIINGSDNEEIDNIF